MLDELIPHHLNQERATVPQLGQTIDHIHHQMEPVNVILHPHIKGRGDGALLLVAPDVELTVGDGDRSAHESAWGSRGTRR